MSRPPLSHERLSDADDGRLHLRFQRPWDEGTTGLLLTPEQLSARLLAILPQPRRNLVHDHGVLAPAARLRSLVVPAPPEAEHDEVPDLVRCVHLPRCSQQPWIPWSELLWRVFGADALACPACGARMAVHAVLHGVWATRRVLTSLGAPAHQPRLWPRGPPRTAP